MPPASNISMEERKALTLDVVEKMREVIMEADERMVSYDVTSLFTEAFERDYRMTPNSATGPLSAATKCDCSLNCQYEGLLKVDVYHKAMHSDQCF